MNTLVDLSSENAYGIRIPADAATVAAGNRQETLQRTAGAAMQDRLDQLKRKLSSIR